MNEPTAPSETIWLAGAFCDGCQREFTAAEFTENQFSEWPVPATVAFVRAHLSHRWQGCEGRVLLSQVQELATA